MNLNETHDPGLKSWVDSANLDGADFPIQNLPLAVFRLRVSDQAFRGGHGQYVQQQGPYPQQLEDDGIGSIVAQVGPLIGPCAFSSLAASSEWLQTDMAQAFTRAYANARRYLNEVPASEIAAIEQPYFPGISLAALTQCIATYQQLGCWTPHVEITQPAFEVTLDVFEYTGGIQERYPWERVCAAPPSI